MLGSESSKARLGDEEWGRVLDVAHDTLKHVKEAAHGIG